MKRFPIVMLAALSLLAHGCAVNPVTQRSELSFMSEAEEVRLGKQLYPRYTQASGGLYPDPELQSYINRVGQGLARVSHRPSLEYEFNVVNGSEINAYALPGGKISITRGLLAKMENEAQLAAVLGHEVGHVTARHASAGKTRGVLASILTAAGAIAIEASGVEGKEALQVGTALSTGLVLKKYSRDQERQSDQLGMEYMVAVGKDPASFARAMEHLKVEGRRNPNMLESFFSSHPLTDERIVDARDRARQLASRYPGAKATGEVAFAKATTGIKKTREAYRLGDEGRKALKEDPKLALAKLEEATSKASDHALLWVWRTQAALEVEKVGEAVKAGRRAVELDPELYFARMAAATAELEAGEYEASVANLAAADKLVPGQPTTNFLTGRNREEQGRIDEAAASYKRVLSIESKGKMADYCRQRLKSWGYN